MDGNNLPRAKEFWSQTGAERLSVLPALVPQAGLNGRPHNLVNARKLLEAELDGINQLAAYMRSRYNALSSTSHLPAEVLVRIFVSLRQIEPSKVVPKCLCEPHLRGFRGTVIGWLKVTHVCRQWREAALAHPALWSDIIFTLGTKWRDEMLRRSRMAPLDVRVVTYSSSEPTFTTPNKIVDIQNILSQHSRHIRHLNLSLPSEHWEQTILMLCCPTPVLENAELVLKGGLLYLPSHIFGRDAPRLRCLRLSGWRISWPALTFNLTELRLEKGQPDPQATYEEFLSALRRFPALEVLSLSDIIPPLPPSATLDTSFGSAVTLSTLRYLTLRDDMLVCALTLKHLSVPLATEQTIECSPSEVFSRSIDLMFPWLDSRLDISSVNKLSILDTPSGVQFVAWDDPRHDDGDVPSAFPVSTPLIDLTIGKATAQEPVRALILTICGKLPLADLKALSVLADDTWEAQHWLDTFGDAKKVTQAQVGCGCAPSFCEALSKADPSHSINEDSLVGPEEAGLLFPHLRHLTLMCTSIENTLPEFLDCRHGLRRLALKIVQCDIDDETINGLRDTISDVQWDGKYGRFD